jgi:hypothetical protein
VQCLPAAEAADAVGALEVAVDRVVAGEGSGAAGVDGWALALHEHFRLLGGSGLRLDDDPSSLHAEVTGDDLTLGLKQKKDRCP